MRGELFFQATAADGPPGRRLVLLRHGRTAWNAEGRAQGQADVELDDLGHTQAAEVAPHVAALAPDVLWSSDLARARQTAAYVEKESGLVAVLDPRLREFAVGQRQGLTIAEFAERFPEQHAAWTSGDDAVPLPGTEATVEVAVRMRSALEDVLDSLAPGGTGVVVTHGAALKVALADLLDWPQVLATSLQGLDNCRWAALTETAFEGRLRLTTYNGGPDPA